jgi:hypothetical protein
MKGNSKAKTPREYINALPEPKKNELIKLNALIQKTTGLKPAMMWGMLEYGKFHYRYATGREGDWCSLALASQKHYIPLYVCMASKGRYIAETYKAVLPQASIGKSCVRFKRLGDIDLRTLTKLLKENHTAYRTCQVKQH